jgi:4,5-dihydroxyphthalate decarboxylase
VLTLTLACGDYDRARPILDGRVGVAGARIAGVKLPSEQTFPRAVTRAEFDVTELSLASHLVQLSRGEAAYVALPVPIARAFRHAQHVGLELRGGCEKIEHAREVPQNRGEADQKQVPGRFDRGLLHRWREGPGVGEDEVALHATFLTQLGKRQSRFSADKTVLCKYTCQYISRRANRNFSML